MYGANVVEMTKTDIETLQRIENSVYRQIFHVPNYSQRCALRGEAGASSMRSRIMEGKIKLLKHTKIQGEDSLLGRITSEFKSMRKAKWTYTLKEYLKETNIEYRELDKMTKETIKARVREWDTKEWKKELLTKKSLELYKNWRTEIGGNEHDYDNTPASVTLFKSRTNILPLNDRNRHKLTENNLICQLCLDGIEDLEHFIILCPCYSQIRNKAIELQQPYLEHKEVVIGIFLFEKQNIYRKKKVLQEMWRSRDKKIKQLNNEST